MGPLGHLVDRVLPEPDPRRLRRAFFDRYAGRSLIVHGGFPDGWLGKLCQEPGGAGHFRIDIRQRPFREKVPLRRLYPVQWLVREHILPLDLPLPVLIRVHGRDHLKARHLRRHGGLCDPAEVAMIYADMVKRPHVLLVPEDKGFAVDRLLEPGDSRVASPYGLI